MNPPPVEGPPPTPTGDPGGGPPPSGRRSRRHKGRKQGSPAAIEDTAPADILSTSPFDDDLEEELASPPRTRALPGPTVYLSAGVLLVAGFFGGIKADQWWGSDQASAGGRTGLAGGRPGGGYGGGGFGGGYGGPMGGMGGYGGGQPGQAGGGQAGNQGGQGGFGPGGGGMGGGGGFTSGTITKISGNTIYLRTSDGKTVKVTTSGSTTVRITKNGKVADLGTGTTIVVQGTTNQDGSVTAATVNQGGTTRPRQ